MTENMRDGMVKHLWEGTDSIGNATSTGVKEVQLLDFLRKVVWASTITSLFGPDEEMLSDTFYRAFRTFDDSFHLALAGVPSAFMKEFVGARASMQAVLGRMRKERASFSQLVNRRVQLLRDALDAARDPLVLLAGHPERNAI